MIIKNKLSIIWTVVFGILGILATVLVYEFSKKEREIIYSVKKTPSLVFDSNSENQKIKLVIDDSIQINENIYLTTIVIWNNGNLEIKKTDIRQEINIKLSNKGKIIDYKIMSETNPGISNFRLDTIRSLLVLDWDYFDPKFGVEIQLLYSGNENSNVSVEGYIFNSKIKKVIAYDNSLYNYMQFYFYFLVVVFLFVISTIKYRFTRNKKRAITLVILTSISLILSFYLTTITYPSPL